MPLAWANSISHPSHRRVTVAPSERAAVDVPCYGNRSSHDVPHQSPSWGFPAQGPDQASVHATQHYCDHPERRLLSIDHVASLEIKTLVQYSICQYFIIMLLMRRPLSYLYLLSGAFSTQRRFGRLRRDSSRSRWTELASHHTPPGVPVIRLTGGITIDNTVLHSCYPICAPRLKHHFYANVK